MLDYGFYNMDCMDGMKEFPDQYFDLAIVDPVYGDVTKGGYMAQKGGERWANGKAAEREYNNNIWKQEKTGKEYFDELFRVSKNVIIWGGQLLRRGDRAQFSRVDYMGQTKGRRRKVRGCRISLYII